MKLDRRPRRPEPQALLYARVALFLLAAGVWLGGVMVGDDRITLAGLLLAAAVWLGSVLLRRRRDE